MFISLFLVHGRFDLDGTFVDRMGHLGFVFSFLDSLPCMMMDKLLMCRGNMMNGK